VDGQWSDWGPWSTCTASCDEGSQVRYRACDSPAPSNGGATCLGLDTESQACTITNCPGIKVSPDIAHFMCMSVKPEVD